MRRWTLLVISHDSEAPKSISISERALRAAIGGGIIVFLVAMIGVGTIIAQLGSLSPEEPVARVASVLEPNASPEVRALRERVSRLRGQLDTIRHHESALRASAGLPDTDSVTMLRRFLTRVPLILRSRARSEKTETQPPRRGEPASPALPSLDWSDSAAVRRHVDQTSASADSLAMHAASVATQFGDLAGGIRIRRDTLVVFSLRADSLAASFARGVGATRTGHAIEWVPVRVSAVAAGMDGVVTRLVQAEPGMWDLDIRGVGNLVSHLRAPGRPLVRAGERIVRDQLLLVVDPDLHTTSVSRPVRYELRRLGRQVDPLKFAAPTTR